MYWRDVARRPGALVAIVAGLGGAAVTLGVVIYMLLHKRDISSCAAGYAMGPPLDAVTGIVGLSCASARMAPIIAAPPAISYFIFSMLSAGLMEMPPVTFATLPIATAICAFFGKWLWYRPGGAEA